MDNQVRFLLNLCLRAKKIVTGEEGCEKALATGTAKLVITSVEASANTKKKFRNKSLYYDTPFYIYFTKEEIGEALGKGVRTTIAITDEALADKVRKWLDDNS